nr:hypothetical protein [Tanacetum cinerariifolium]
VSAEPNVDCPSITYSFCVATIVFMGRKARKNERDSKEDKEKVVEPPKRRRNQLKESNIHSHDPVEQQNSKIMGKEDVLAEFDAIKTIVDIIDKKKGEVSTSCLEKEPDLVKDRITMFEKCFELRYHDTSKDSIKQVCYKQHDFHCSKSDSAVSDVFHQEVASKKKDWSGKGSGFIYAESQDSLLDAVGITVAHVCANYFCSS